MPPTIEGAARGVSVLEHLQPAVEERARVVFFVPRWLPSEWTDYGLPYRVFPVLSSLAHCGIAVDLFTEPRDGFDVELLRAKLDGARAGVVWCAELNPGIQIAGMIRALETMREAAPGVPRFAGGGFHALFPRGLEMRDLADVVVPGEDIADLSRALCERLGVEMPRAAARYDGYAATRLDLSSFIRVEPMIFDNRRRSLQLPTGYGCAKRCGFCFYERTKVQLLSGKDIAALMAHCVKRYGVTQFLLGELDFFTSVSRVRQMATAILESGLDVSWFALVSVQDALALSDADIDLIVRAGCKVLEMGTEVGSDRALRAIGKSFSAEDPIRASERFLARGVSLLHNIIFGFVGETRADRRATVDLVRRLEALSPRVRFNFRVYQPTPTTTMGEEAFKHLDAVPTSLKGLTEYRYTAGRALPWLEPGAEDEIRFLADYVLPLGFDDPFLRGKSPSPARRFFRAIARGRARAHVYKWRFDRSLFKRFESVGLPTTFLP
jgi:radical SAM superfamily enzyme YgiQ (UPF0313 family)